jgi:hypothetical protein
MAENSGKYMGTDNSSLLLDLQAAPARTPLGGDRIDCSSHRRYVTVNAGAVPSIEMLNRHIENPSLPGLLKGARHGLLHAAYIRSRLTRWLTAAGRIRWFFVTRPLGPILVAEARAHAPICIDNVSSHV